MKILILAGGTGSIALQTGLHQLTSEFEGLETKVLVNAYDNGLSTGAVRKVMGGHILGPSDVRKNQTTMHNLKTSGAKSALSKFLDIRFTCSAMTAQNYCLSQLGQLNGEVDKYHIETMKKAIVKYFSFSSATRIDYNDFSLANIVYAGLAAVHGNSLRAAARVMADILNIDDNVLLNDDTSLFLGAITRSGKVINDEGDIVSWNNPEDPIVDLTFIDAYGEEREPILCEEAERAIAEADMIILSSGTQWSSLIPTYATRGFKEAIEDAKAKVLMVMNKVPDKDAPDQSASDIIKTLVPKYIPAKRLNVMVDLHGHQIMNKLDLDACSLIESVNYFKFSAEWMGLLRTHDPVALGVAVFKTYFKDYLHAKAYVFDYDDTLVGRGHTHIAASLYNNMALNSLNAGTSVTEISPERLVAICSGNSIKAIKLRPVRLPHYQMDARTKLTVYADGGINEYDFAYQETAEDEPAPTNFVGCTRPEALFSASAAETIIEDLRSIGIPTAKIENRGNAVIAIKPIDPEYRTIVANLIRTKIAPEMVHESGRTTVEISKDGVSKDAAILQMLSKLDHDEQLVFVGDEFEGGNDEAIRVLAEAQDKIKCLPVNSPTDTALFFIALLGSEKITNG
jgi:2-phospho-L-lactate transferase/gluconeogenesis factor (CofD/UPF0052 family)